MDVSFALSSGSEEMVALNGGGSRISWGIAWEEAAEDTGTEAAAEEGVLPGADSEADGLSGEDETFQPSSGSIPDMEEAQDSAGMAADGTGLSVSTAMAPGTAAEPGSGYQPGGSVSDGEEGAGYENQEEAGGSRASGGSLYQEKESGGGPIKDWAAISEGSSEAAEAGSASTGMGSRRESPFMPFGTVRDDMAPAVYGVSGYREAAGESQDDKGQPGDGTEPEETADNKAYNMEQMKIENHNSGGCYTELLPGIDIQYTVSSVNIKENILVKSRDAAWEDITLRINHPGTMLIMEEDGSISVKENASEEEALYRFMAPFMYDAAGAFSEAVEYILTEESGGAALLTIRADREWMLSEDREYPVTIDPVTQTTRDRSTIEDTFVSEAEPDNAGFGSHGRVYVGRSHPYEKIRGLVRFTRLP